MTLNRVDKILLNALIVAGITLFSTLQVSYPPTMANVYAGATAAGIALLTQLKTLTVDEEKTDPPKLGMLI